jgi:hypothetical protein
LPRKILIPVRGENTFNEVQRKCITLFNFYFILRSFDEYIRICEVPVCTHSLFLGVYAKISKLFFAGK